MTEIIYYAITLIEMLENFFITSNKVGFEFTENISKVLVLLQLRMRLEHKIGHLIPAAAYFLNLVRSLTIESLLLHLFCILLVKSITLLSSVMALK